MNRSLFGGLHCNDVIRYNLFPASSDTGPQLLFWAGSQAACVKITVSCICNVWNYGAIFTLQM